MQNAPRDYCRRGRLRTSQFYGNKFSLVERGIVSQMRPLCSKEWSFCLIPFPFTWVGV